MLLSDLVLFHSLPHVVLCFMDISFQLSINGVPLQSAAFQLCQHFKGQPAAGRQMDTLYPHEAPNH